MRKERPKCKGNPEHYFIACENCGPLCANCGTRPNPLPHDVPSGLCAHCTLELAALEDARTRRLESALIPGLQAILERNGKGPNQGGPLAELQKALRLNNSEFARTLGITRWKLLRYKRGQELRPSTIRRIIATLKQRETPPGSEVPEGVSLCSVA